MKYIVAGISVYVIACLSWAAWSVHNTVLQNYRYQSYMYSCDSLPAAKQINCYGTVYSWTRSSAWWLGKPMKKGS